MRSLIWQRFCRSASSCKRASISTKSTKSTDLCSKLNQSHWKRQETRKNYWPSRKKLENQSKWIFLTPIRCNRIFRRLIRGRWSRWPAWTTICIAVRLNHWRFGISPQCKQFQSWRRWVQCANCRSRNQKDFCFWHRTNRWWYGTWLVLLK